MKRLLIAGAALLAATSLSTAADMPVEAPPMEAAVEEFSWSGVYIGMHGGWAWAEADVTLDAFPDDEFGFDADDFVIGGQIGYNWAWDSWLLGIEGDGSFAGLGDEDDDLLLSTDHEFLASIRGRLGLTFDRFLVYGTGGAAWAGFSIDDDDPAFGDDDETTFFGWAAGGGIEYAITDNVSLGVEYLHYEFDDEGFDFDDPLLAGLEANLSVDVVRGRLNVKFDSIFD
jgi:outer membrane immunogenic protein